MFGVGETPPRWRNVCGTSQVDILAATVRRDRIELETVSGLNPRELPEATNGKSIYLGQLFAGDFSVCAPLLHACQRDYGLQVAIEAHLLGGLPEKEVSLVFSALRPR